MGRFQRALYEQVLSSVCQACQGPRVPRLAAGRHDSIGYVARFTELAHFVDEYVAIDLSKVRRFEDGLRLSIRGKDPRILGCCSSNHQWDWYEHAFFSLWVRGTCIRLRVLHKHLQFHRQAREDKAIGRDFGDLGACLRHYPTD